MLSAPAMGSVPNTSHLTGSCDGPASQLLSECRWLQVDSGELFSKGPFGTLSAPSLDQPRWSCGAGVTREMHLPTAPRSFPGQLQLYRGAAGERWARELSLRLSLKAALF